MRRIVAPLVLTVLASLAVPGLVAPAFADGFIVIRPSPPEQPQVRNVPLAVKYHRVTVNVEGRVAVTDVDQVFVNHNPRRVEGTYIFPLPEGAAIDRFSMWVDGKELSAELLDAGKARSIYEEIVRRQQDPALLEYMDRALFKARIFPIEPNSEKRVRIRYAEVLPADNGTVAYRYPLNTEKFSSRPLEDVAVSVTIQDDAPVTALFSPSHNVDVPENLGSKVTVGWEARNVTPDRDFLLYWRPTHKDVGFSVITHRDGDKGTFLLVLSPTPAADLPAMPKDVVFVLDTSGSMVGKKMEQARAALRFCLRSLGKDDRFGIVPFATEPRPFKESLVGAAADYISAAERFVDGLEARGGTAIDDALRTGLGLLARRDGTDRPGMVFFVTDGLPTIGETNADKIVERAAKVAPTARVFVFGVGTDVNTRMLDRLALENRGTRDYVAETESIEEKVSNLYAKLAKPAMTDLELRVEGVDAEAVHPKALGDLFHGGELLVVGRYAKPGNAVVRLTGKIAGKPCEIVEEVRFPETATTNSFLPRLWAVRRVAFLLEEIRLHGESAEMKDEVVRLAKAHGIVTPYTSYLILEDETRVRDGWTSGMPPRPEAPAGPGPGFFGGEGTGRGSAHKGGGGGGGGGSASGGADVGGASGPAPTPAESAAGERVRRAASDAADGTREESGKKSVDLSKGLKELKDYRGDRDDEKLEDEEALVRHLSGRTFVSRGGVWWEHDIDAKAARRVVAPFSDEYFALVKTNPGLGRYLVLGKVILKVGDEVIEVR